MHVQVEFITAATITVLGKTKTFKDVETRLYPTFIFVLCLVIFLYRFFKY